MTLVMIFMYCGSSEVSYMVLVACNGLHDEVLLGVALIFTVVSWQACGC